MIRADTVSVVSDGNMLGEMPTSRALELAKEKELDLVEVAPNQKPPVCKIMSYSKFKYEEKKKARKGKIRGKAKDLKEMRFSPNIGEGDLQHKLNRIKEFLRKGHKVKITIFFKGRRTGPEPGNVLVEKILTGLKENCTIEQALKRQGRRWFMTVAPLKTSNKKIDSAEEVNNVSKSKVNLDNMHHGQVKCDPRTRT